MVTQKIPSRYVTKGVLERFLTDVFGSGFSVEVDSGYFLLDISRPLTLDEQEQLQDMGKKEA